MRVNSVWLLLSIVIIFCGSGIRSEAHATATESRLNLKNCVSSPQAGRGQGSSSSSTGESRSEMATGRGHRIPKPAEGKRDRGSRRKKSGNGKKKKGKGKSKKKFCKKKIRKKKVCQKKVSKKRIYKKLKKQRKLCQLCAAGDQNCLKRKNRLAENDAESWKLTNDKKCRPNITTERADDVPLLIGIMKGMGLAQVLDKHIPVHWKQRNLSWGRTCIIWLAYILSEGNHCKVSVRDYIKDMRTILSVIMGQKIEELYFTDDRCGILLKNLSKREYWVKIEKELSERTIEAYELPKKIVRCDATTVSGYHKIEKGGLFQIGISKDDPHRPQIKIMASALDPLGMPLATDVVSGEQADDVLYRPLIKRMNEYLGNNAVIYAGDCKLGAFETRLYIRSIEKHYLCPLPMTGKMAIQMKELIRIGVMKDKQDGLNRVYAEKDDAEVLIAKGYEYRRKHTGEYEGEKTEWMERVLIVNSPSYAKSQARGLEKRLKKATEKLYALTPQRGPGKRQITDESLLKAAIDNISKRYKVDGLLRCKYEKEIERVEKYIGKGRGSADRPKKIIERVRYQITEVERRGYRVRRAKERQGWKVFVTDVSQKRLSFGDVVKCYRMEYRVERVFTRMKSRLKAAPYYVKKGDQVVGMTNLLTLGVRVLTLTEYIVRRSLQKDGEKLKGLHPENRKKMTDSPTTERLLKAFSKITLTIIKSGCYVKRHLTPLTDLQKDILRRAGLNCSIYKDLEFVKSPSKLSEW